VAFHLTGLRKATGDLALTQARIPARNSIILDLCLTAARFEMFPTLLVPDGSFMIDRRMGSTVTLWKFKLCFMQLCGTTVARKGEQDIPQAVSDRLSYRLSRTKYYWLDLDGLNKIYRYGVEEFGASAMNWLNIYPRFRLVTNGYRKGLPVGNLGPAWMDFRFFTQGFTGYHYLPR